MNEDSDESDSKSIKDEVLESLVQKSMQILNNDKEDVHVRPFCQR